jgi:hypothetical protein
MMFLTVIGQMGNEVRKYGGGEDAGD